MHRLFSLALERQLQFSKEWVTLWRPETRWCAQKGLFACQFSPGDAGYSMTLWDRTCLNPWQLYTVGFTGMSEYGVGEGEHRGLLPKAFITYVRDKCVQRSHKHMVVLIIRFFQKTDLLWPGFPVASHKYHHSHPPLERQRLCVVIAFLSVRLYPKGWSRNIAGTSISPEQEKVLSPPLCHPRPANTTQPPNNTVWNAYSVS